MYCVAPRRSAADPSARTRLKPVLNAADFLALLNQRLQAHPMYLEGMAFPVAWGDEEEGADERAWEPDQPPTAQPGRLDEARDEGADEDGAGYPKLPLLALVRDTRWDHFGVFASVIDDVKQHYELAPAMAAASPAACRQRLGPLAGKTARLRQAAR